MDEDVMGSLATYELKLEKRRIDQDMIDAFKPSKNKSKALKGVTQDEEDDVSSNDEDMALFARRFNKYLGLNKKGGQKVQKLQKSQKFQKSSREEKGKNKPLCYKCDKPNHIQADCRKTTIIKRRKSTWLEGP